MSYRVGKAAESGGLRTEGLLGSDSADKKPKTLRKAEGAFLPALTDHVGGAAESGGVRPEGLGWVQFCCNEAEDALEGRNEL